MADKNKDSDSMDILLKVMSFLPPVNAPLGLQRIPVLTEEEITVIKENEQEIQELISERRLQEQINQTELKKLTLEKEREIVNLIKTAEEVEIEEVTDSANGFNLSALVSQSGVGASAGKDNAVSNYRRYKFKRGGEKTEIETPSDDQTEK